MFALVVLSLVLAEAQFQTAESEAKVTSLRVDKYDPEELLSRILGFNETTSRQAGYGLEPTQLFFPTESSNLEVPSEQNPSSDPQNPPKKRRRRRRKPKLQNGVNPGYGLQLPDGLGTQLPGQPIPGYGPGSQLPGQTIPGYGLETQLPGQPIPGYGLGNQLPVQPIPGYGLGSELPGQPIPGYGLENQLPGQPIPEYGYQPGLDLQNYGLYNGQQQRPARRPRVRGGGGALAAVSGALGNIARHDDYQCVPRLLCEVASGRDTGGGGGGGTASFLPSFINMQPLVTLLAAYNGVSASPLFVFGRAALLGASSQGNAASCRYAYPRCPADPDQLLDYLNNHNGGFFRFFSAIPDPGLLGPSAPFNLGQANFNNGQANFNNGQANFNHGQTNINYGQANLNNQNAALVARPQLQQFYSNLVGALNQNNQPNFNNDQNNPQPSYGLYQGSQVAGNYGKKYDYGSNKIRFKNNELEQDKVDKNKIEDRIQNQPSHKFEYVSSLKEHDDPINKFVVKNNIDEGNTKWSFPDSANEIIPNNIRPGKFLKFPQNIQDTESTTSKPSNGLAKGFIFPESQSNRNYIEYYNYPPVINPNDFPLKTGTGDLKFDASNQEGVNFGHYTDPSGEEFYMEEDGEIVYVLRGDGDPNNPEVIRLRPGQRLN